MDGVERLGLLGGLVHGRLAGVEDEDGHVAVVQELPEFSTRYRPHFVLAGMLKQQVAMFACVFAAQCENVDRLQPIGQCGLAQIFINAVPVEMDDVVGPPGSFGVGQHLLQPLEGGRTQGGDGEASQVCTEILKQAVGHGPQANVAGSARTADDVQQAHAPIVGIRHGHKSDVGIGLNPNKRLHPQGDGRIRLGVAHQFPGNGGRFGNAGGDFDAQIGQLGTDGEPDRLRIHIGCEDFRIKLLTPLLHQRLDLLDLDLRHGRGALQVVFHVPAQVCLLLIRQGKLDRGLGLDIRLPRTLQGETDGVFSINGSILADVQNRVLGHCCSPGFCCKKYK